MKEEEKEISEEKLSQIEEVKGLFDSASAEKQWDWVVNIAIDPLNSDGLELELSKDRSDLILTDEDVCSTLKLV